MVADHLILLTFMNFQIQIAPYDCNILVSVVTENSIAVAL